jgi:cell fate regulator YaaT (PSP1 superfamily)
MENQKQNNPVENGEKNTHPGENGGKNNRNRHHRGRNHHRGKGGSRPENAGEQAVKNLAESQSNGTETPKDQKSNQGNHKNRETQKANNGNRDKKRNNRGGKGNNHGEKKRGGYSVEKRPYDPYEEPIAEELSLEELRARIVVKSADTEPAPTDESPALTAPVEEVVAEENELITVSSPDTDREIVLEPATTEPVADNRPRVEIIGIRFRSSGKMYYFDPHGIAAKKGDHAIVETARGPEFGDVCLGNTMVCESDVVSPLRPILRLATPADVAHNEENRVKEQHALEVCRQKVAAHKLEMKLIDVQYAFDNSKLLFYFTADGRVDFRELVKDLASVFRTRIELRQIGIRDEAKLLGGLGACGRPLCCSTFLPDFAQVSIKMAKEQNLSLNSTKISGVCGRLMCCLRFESEVYAEEIKLTPAVDSWVKTEDGVGTVISTNPLAGTVRVILKDSPDTPPKQFHRNEVTVLERRHRETLANEDSNEKKNTSDGKNKNN